MADIFAVAKYIGYEKTIDLESNPTSPSVHSDSTLDVVSTDTPSSKSRIDPRIISDAIIGLADGLTVPFALTAGLSAIGDTKVVIFGGFAELIAGAISMGLGGYLGAKSEDDSYKQTHLEIKDQIASDPASAYSQVSQVFSEYDIPPALVSQVTAHVSSSTHLPDFLMRFHHDIPVQTSSRAFSCAITIALGYFLGGLIPLLPYIFVDRQDVTTALCFSVGVMVLALFVFGYCRTAFVSGWAGSRCFWKNAKGGAQMVIVGGAAAGSAMGLVRAFNSFL